MAEKDTVTVQVGVQGLLVKVAVTPDGRLDAENVTGTAVPLTSVAVTDDVGLVPPRVTVRLAGDGVERLKSKAATTVNDRLVEWLAPPPEAPIDSVAVPRVAVAVAEKETVTVQVGLHGLLVKVAVTPVGRPDAEKVTGVVVPVDSVAVIIDDGLVEPWTTVRLLGEGVEREKPKAAPTATVDVKPDSCMADRGPSVPAGVPVSWTRTEGWKVPPEL